MEINKMIIYDLIYKRNTLSVFLKNKKPERCNVNKIIFGNIVSMKLYTSV